MKNVQYSNAPLSSRDVSTIGVTVPAADLPSSFSLDTTCNGCIFQAGETIFTEGSPADKAYIIETGLVEIFVGDENEAIQLNTLGPGDIFGEMGLIDAFPRSASAKALSLCRCLVVSAAQIAERIESSPPMVKMLISMALHRNRTYNSYLKAHVQGAKNGFIDPVSTQNTFDKNPQYQKILEDIKLESELQNAVRSQELELHYQPLFNLNGKKLVGFEALLRWRSPSRGMVSPSQFIRIAEETSLIVPLGFWIVQQACLDLKRFQDQLRRCGKDAEQLFLSINISVKQFQNPGFLDQLMATTRRYGIAPQRVKLEVTERIFLDTAEAIDTIAECRKAGFEVSLDDFGTGYSSLNYLERCEIDSLKIDQSFIQKLGTSEKSRILVGSIIEISKKLGLPTVAEGIETPSQVHFLQQCGCEMGQGFLFSRPVGFNQALSLLQRHTP